ncbi:MAG: hydroxysqualene dehydroxylase HpnE [Chloroflexi bacterium]|nr:hydroxysqualene dehydroxylase HpnE [Chloroflexota bacterium]MCY3937950.1 hydroxysqualene dehydroxylase HpnE [Chloroflexota bacterium]
MSRPHVVVAGGGLAGLTAAIACVDGGARVTLLEGKRHLGGATYSFERDGLMVDNGQHVFLRCCEAYMWFLERVGVADKVTLQSRLEIPVVGPTGETAWLKSSRLPAPLQLGPSLARFKFLKLVERLRVAFAARKLAAVDLSDSEQDEHSFHDWLRQHGQSERSIDSFWDLIVLPTLNVPSSRASLTLAAKVFQTGLLEDGSAADLGYSAVPLSELHADPAEELLHKRGSRVLKGVRVRSIGASSGGFQVAVHGGDSFSADAVVVAVPHESAAQIVPREAVGDPPQFQRLGTSPIVNLHVIYDRKVMDWPHAAGIDGPVQWVFDRTNIAGCERGQYLAVSLSAADEYVGESNSALKRKFLDALASVFPKARGASVESFFVTREYAATFLQSPGSAALRPGPVTRMPGLFLAGAWTDTGWPATMEGAVRSGLSAAREALRSLNLPSRDTPIYA